MKHSIPINLNTRKVSSRGRAYVYWVLRWTDHKHNARIKYLGKAEGPGKMSQRQATLEKSRLHAKINSPDYAELQKPDRLKVFLDTYLKSRKKDLQPDTLKLHALTVRYLLAHFDENTSIDQIKKRDARDFKTALGNGELKYVSQKPKDLCESSIDLHIRQCRTMFNQPVEDEVLTKNPFSHLCRSRPVEMSWHYVTSAEYQALYDAAPTLNWKVLFALCRLAGLRRSEALNMEWINVDFERSRLEVISKPNWRTKTRKARTIPVNKDLQVVLTEAYEAAAEGQRKIMVWDVDVNIDRGFHVIRKRAGVDQYADPLHAMRKSCAQDWAGKNVHPKTLKEWMGHSSFETTMRHYLKVAETEYEAGSNMSFLSESGQISGQTKKDLTLTDEKKECIRG